MGIEAEVELVRKNESEAKRGRGERTEQGRMKSPHAAISPISAEEHDGGEGRGRTEGEHLRQK